MSSAVLQRANVSAAVAPAPRRLPQSPQQDNPFSRRFWTAPIDLRPLALMRITLGSVVLWSLASVAPVLRALLSDDGVLPRSVLLGGVARADRFSIFDVAGPLPMTWALWLLAVAATAAFVVGWRTRAASIATFILVSGLHERNPMIFDGSDSVARVFLFWCLFLPVGAAYSIDAAQRRRSHRPLSTIGHPFVVRLLQLQLCWIYFCTFLCKIGDRTWQDGSALHYAFGLDHLFTRRLGAALFNASWLTVPATYGTLVFEAAFVFLIFAPFQQSRLRKLTLWAGFGLHLGIAVTMSVGNFSLMMLASYPLLLESRSVESLLARARRALPSRWRDRLVALRSLPVARPELPSPSALPRRLHVARSVGRALLATALVAAMVYSLPGESGARLPRPLASVIRMVELWQRWDMFAPRPLPTDRKLRSEGVLTDGRKVDVLHGLAGGPVSFHGIDSNHRWTKYALGLTKEQPSRRRTRLFAALSRYLCASWNRGNGEPLDHFALYEDSSLTPAPGDDERQWKTELLWEHDCD